MWVGKSSTIAEKKAAFPAAIKFLADVRLITIYSLHLLNYLTLRDDIPLSRSLK